MSATVAGRAEREFPSRRKRSDAVAQIVTLDLIASGIAVLAAFVLRFGGNTDVLADLCAAVLLPPIWVGGIALNRGYDLRLVGVGTIEFGRLARTFAHIVVFTAFVSYLAGLELARGFVLLALPLILLLSWTGRLMARLHLHHLRRTGRAMHRVLIVGSAASVQALAASMTRDQSVGLHADAACLPIEEATDPGVVRRLAERGIAVLGDLDAVRDAADRSGASSVAVIAGDVGTGRVRLISWELEGSDTDLFISTGLTEFAKRRVHVQSIAGAPLLRVDEPRFTGFNRVLKDMFDRTVAALAIVVLSPLLVLLGALVWLTSRGPALYFQTRVGLNGQHFRMVKFRSMAVGSDARVADLVERNEGAAGVLFKIRQDPRVTRVGRILRRFSLDELPQLFNVLDGSMSLVGPRPPLPEEVARYGAHVQRRLLVKPGLTGLWQISGRSDLSWEESVRLDLHYVENWSFAMDMVVLLKTARVVVKATGAY